jgi:hypothetical protein
MCIGLVFSHTRLRTEPIEREAVSDEAKRPLALVAMLHDNLLSAAALFVPWFSP